jgi:hypothetical protein
MRRRHLIRLFGVVFAVILSAACTEQSLAAGYWNMPGTHAQRTGHGYGGGYHAPMILGPLRCEGWHLGSPVRLPYAPAPYYGCGTGRECGRTIDAPTSMKNIVPTTAPTQAPVPAAAAPVEKQIVESTPTVTSEADVQDAEPDIEPLDEQVIEPLQPLFDPPVQP